MITVHFALAHQELLKGIIMADSAAARPDVPMSIELKRYPYCPDPRHGRTGRACREQ